MDRAPAAPAATAARRTGAAARGAGRRAVALVAAVAVAVVACAVLSGPGSPSVAGAQTEASTTTTVAVPPDPQGTPFPAQLVATLPPPAEGTPPELALTGFYAAPGDGGEDPTIVLRFAAPFEVPSSRWRASVLAGDPTGERVRVSIFARGGETSTEVELGDGSSWISMAFGDVTFEPSGLVVATLPLDQVPDGGSLWAEAAIEPTTGEDQVVRSPWFARAAVLGTGEPGLVPSSTLGRTEALALGDVGPDATTTTTSTTTTSTGDEAPVPLGLGPGPTLGLAAPGGGDGRSVVLVRWPAPPLVEVDGSEVVEQTDLVRIAPDDRDDATATPYVSVDRTTGAVTLVEGRAWPLEDRSGDRAWYLDANTTVGADGLEVLALDLDALLAALDEDVDRSSVALGLTRTVRLADGRQVVADGVLGTTAWLDQAVDLTVPTTVAPPATEPPPAEDRSTGLTFAGWVALALLVVGWLAVLRTLRVRRRQRREAADGDLVTAAALVADDDRPWWERSRQPAEPRAAGAEVPAEGATAGGPVAQGAATDEVAAVPGGDEPAADGPAAVDAVAGGDAGRRARQPEVAPAGPGPEDRGAAVVTVAEVEAAGRATDAPPVEAPRHQPRGVTIDADLATDLAVDEPSGAGPDAGRPDPGRPAPGRPAPGPVAPAHPGAVGATDEGAADGSGSGAADPLATLSHDLSELTERLRRLEGDEGT